MDITDQQLFKLLLDNQFIPKVKLEEAFKLSTQKNISLYEAILEKDLLSDENLGNLIADFLKVPFVVLSKRDVPTNLLHLIPEMVAEKQKAIIFEKDKDVVKVATSHPGNKDFWPILSHKTGSKIEVYFATPRDIEESLTLYKKHLQQAFDELLKEQLDEADKAVEKEVPIMKMVDTLIEYAYEDKASDIHIEPGEENSLIRFRIDGILHDVLKLPPNLHEQIISRIKILSKLRTDEHLSAQDGKLQIKLKAEELDVRVSIVPIVDGEKVVLRLLTARFRQFGLADLGMKEADLKKVQEGFEKPFGMILATGPTGSGKTTTIYAILKILNNREKNIATIEDPVEYDIEGVNQIQVNPKTNLTFAEGLKSILRQDPDIIYVGEIRDEETADMAVNAAMTGHLVLSTLHTNDAATALPRLLDMGIEPFLVASTVNVIIAQRLVRKICDKCKVSYTQKLAEITQFFPKDLIKKHLGGDKEIRLFKGKGCAICHSTGYASRIGVFEILQVSQDIQQLISQKADADTLTQKAIQEGMTSMMEDGLDKIQLGITTVEEVIRVINQVT